MARGQRGWNAQPGGGLSSDGGKPGMPRRTAFSSSDGRLAISSWVYGCIGVGEDVAHAADLDQLAGVHDAEAVDELRHQAHVVADQDDGRAQLLLDAGSASP